MTRLDGRMRKVERSMGYSGKRVLSARDDAEADELLARFPDATVVIGAWMKLPPRGPNDA